jgi:hypothetical protein
VPLNRVEAASMVRPTVEVAESSVSEELGTVSREARDAFARLVDVLRYNNNRECLEGGR